MKTILLTGATDGIGKLTAQRLVNAGHRVLVHGRNPDKLAAAVAELGGATESYQADLSQMDQVEAMAAAVAAKHEHLDALINNAGVLKTPHPRLPDGMDLRFVVNTLAPYVLTQRLLHLLGTSGRVVNLSSAAQAPVNTDALMGRVPLQDMAAYSQSKLAITLWTQALANQHPEGPSFVSVNPGSFLATKMVKEGFGMSGNDVGIGADILIEAATGDRFEGRSGSYFDNDAGDFAQPHPAASHSRHVREVMAAIERLVAERTSAP